MFNETFNESFFQQGFEPEKTLLNRIRHSLVTEDEIEIPDKLSFQFDPEISQTYITLFQPGIKKIRWGARRKTLKETLIRIIYKLKTNNRFKEFTINNTDQVRILFEMVTSKSECNIRNLTTEKFGKNRFEPGITGIQYKYNGVERFFMPTDAVTQSIMTVNQLLNFLSKQTGHAKRTNRISERAHLMRRDPVEYKKLNSIAFISCDKRISALYRGYPVPVKFNKQIIYDSMLASINWIVENQNDDGSFLYFYDGIRDTKVDLDHPKMVDPLYNNILRHSGGTITILKAYEYTKDKKYLIAAKKSLDFFISTFREHEYKGEHACYPFFNRKSKLGGAGIGLVALMHYYLHTGDEFYRKYMDGLVRHILSRVAEDGEMIGYFVHPLFNAGEHLTHEFIATLSHEDKKKLFSFYYPGEALLGLALYYRHINKPDKDLLNDIKVKSLKSLDFLVDQRPIRYKELFLPLPADAWLMQAIEEWVKEEEFKKQTYINFVYNDTQKMFDNMYTEENAPWFDYIGGFYYYYQDHVYQDASRCEGVVAAYYLAKYMGDEDRAAIIMQNMLKSAKGILYTRHTSDSLYAHQYPEKSMNTFRFKLTRAWVRVDSVQHAACFFARLYKVWEEN